MKQLLKMQTSEGCWKARKGNEKENDFLATIFAVLFLTRASKGVIKQPYIVSEEMLKEKELER